MNGEAGGGGNLPEIELIIKASAIDGKRKGADIFCQVRTYEHTYYSIDFERPRPIGKIFFNLSHLAVF